jgi:hypothetical protein
MVLDGTASTLASEAKVLSDTHVPCVGCERAYSDLR